MEIRSGGSEAVEFTCTCPAYYQYEGACKHIIAVLLKAYVEHSAVEARPNNDSITKIDKKTPKTDLRLVQSTPIPEKESKLLISKTLIADLSRKISLNVSKEQLSLQVIMHLNPQYSHNMPWIELKIGQQRLYNVKKISEVLETILQSNELYFGKTFTFQPSQQQFSPPDQRLIDFLMEVYQDERSNRYYYSSKLDRHGFELNPSSLRRLLAIAAEMEQAIWHKDNDNSPVPIRVIYEPLPLTLQLTQGKQYLELAMHSPEPIYELPFARGIFISNDCFWFPPTASLQPLQPILECFSKISGETMPITDEDAVAFITEAVPALQNFSKFEIAPEVDLRLHKEPLTITLWLDKNGNGVAAKVIFQYGETMQINPLTVISDPLPTEKLILRESSREKSFINLLTRVGFVSQGESYLLVDEEQIYRFLIESLPELVENAEVYRSETFDSLRVQRPPRFSGAIRLNETTDLLEVSLQMDDLPDTELQKFYAALREKKKYFRLKSGAFIPLDQPETFAVSKLFEQLGLTGNDLQKDLISLPKYRALYLDQAVRDYGRERFNLNSSFKQLVHAVKEPQEIEAAPPEHLVEVLRDYQKTGFKWLKTLTYYGFGGILADDMGLGKTLQVITLVGSEYPGNRRPSLVIAPTSLVYNWQEEIAKFSPDLSVLVLDGQKTERVKLLEQVAEYAFVITSYPLVRRDIDEMKEIQFAFCFLDEAQQIKNPETINAKSVKQIKAGRYFAVTGTPIENSLTELWSIFDFIMPGYLYSHHKFQARFETPVVKNNDSKALEDLGQHIRPFILRRLKKDVLTELPEKIETKMTCEMTAGQKKVYVAYLSQARAEFEAEIQKSGFEKSQIKILALLTRLRQICCHPALFLEDYHSGSGKLELLQEIIQDSLAGGHRILVFSQFVTMLHLIEDHLKKESVRYFRIDGQTPAEERLKRVNQFNQGGAEVFLISLKAGGTGLNLTGADTVIHYDPWWNPAVEEQATDRAYRIGQKNIVQVFKLVTHGTIEEKIHALQQRKKELVDAVIQPGENFLGKMTVTEIRGLFEE